MFSFVLVSEGLDEGNCLSADRAAIQCLPALHATYHMPAGREAALNALVHAHGTLIVVVVVAVVIVVH